MIKYDNEWCKDKGSLVDKEVGKANAAVCMHDAISYQYEDLDQKLWNCASQATYWHSDGLR
jgi:hypothetical protein